MRFELGIFDPTDAWRAPVPAVDWLDEVRAGVPSWVPDLDRCTLFLEIDGVEHVAGKWNLGSLDVVIRQLSAALDRLRRFEIALVRSAVDGLAGVPLYLFEPLGASVVAISSIYLPSDDPHVHDYPIDRGIPGAELLLYAYVAKERVRLLDYGDLDQLDPAVFVGVRVPVGELLSSLDRAVEAGRTVLDVCGAPVE
jgi:hypothetical protein